MSKFQKVTAAVFTASMLAAGAGTASAETLTFTDLQSTGEAALEDQASVEAASSESKALEAEAYKVSEFESYKEAEYDEKSGGDDKLGPGTFANDDTYTFTQLHGDGFKEVNDQLGMNVTASGKDAVSFTFFNNVGDSSSITDVYLAGTDGLLILPGKITEQSPGVSYSIGADPRNLPGGKPFEFVASIGADSNPPVQPNGVSTAKEYVTWTFALASGVTYDSVIKALDAGSLRVGLLVPGMSGGSASFINTCGLQSCSQAPSVPLPASLWLMFGAMGGLAAISRRRKSARTA
jgi:hypothetical protein